MTSSFVGSERSCLRFTRPGGRGVPATAFSNKSAKHPSPESRRGASPGCFQSATRACRVFSYTQLSRKVCIRDRNRTCIQNGASISYARIYICYSKNCSSLSGSTSLLFSIRFGTGRSQTATSSCSCSRLSLSPPFSPRSPRARGPLAPAPAPRGTPYPERSATTSGTSCATPDTANHADTRQYSRIDAGGYSTKDAWVVKGKLKRTVSGL